MSVGISEVASGVSFNSDRGHPSRHDRRGEKLIVQIPMIDPNGVQ